MAGCTATPIAAEFEDPRYGVQNAHLLDLSTPEVCIFGYASLVWKPDVSCACERRAPSCDDCVRGALHAHVRGYVRRFYQASPDHRGTPTVMGRVCTLLATNEVDNVVHGTLYVLSRVCAAPYIRSLLHREKAGYSCLCLPVHMSDGSIRDAYTFTATESNKFWAPGDVSDIAAVIAVARGPSGTNVEYFRNLLHAMRERGVVDAHLEELQVAIEALSPPLR